MLTWIESQGRKFQTNIFAMRRIEYLTLLKSWFFSSVWDQIARANDVCHLKCQVLLISVRLNNRLKVNPREVLCSQPERSNSSSLVIEPDSLIAEGTGCPRKKNMQEQKCPRLIRIKSTCDMKLTLLSQMNSWLFTSSNLDNAIWRYRNFSKRSQDTKMCATCAECDTSLPKALLITIQRKVAQLVSWLLLEILQYPNWPK